MPKPAKAKRKVTSKSTVRAHEVAARRRKVSLLRAKGYELSEIAQRTGVSYPTICKDMRVVEEQWHQQTMKAFSEIVGQELGRLELLRQQVLRCFYAARNRHGEKLQVGYMAQYIKLTERIHALLRLEDPNAKQSEAKLQSMHPVPLVVRSREEANRLAPGGVADHEAIRRLLEARN